MSLKNLNTYFLSCAIMLCMMACKTPIPPAIGSYSYPQYGVDLPLTTNEIQSLSAYYQYVLDDSLLLNSLLENPFYLCNELPLFKSESIYEQNFKLKYKGQKLETTSYLTEKECPYLRYAFYCKSPNRYLLAAVFTHNAWAGKCKHISKMVYELHLKKVNDKLEVDYSEIKAGKMVVTFL